MNRRVRSVELHDWLIAIPLAAGYGLVLAVLAFFVFISVSSSLQVRLAASRIDPSAYVGTWVSEKPGTPDRLDLRADGTFTRGSTTITGGYVARGQYSLTPTGTLVFRTASGDVSRYRLIRGFNTRYTAVPQTMALVAQEASGGETLFMRVPMTESDMHGTWRSGETTITFEPDGTFAQNGQGWTVTQIRGRWWFDGRDMTLDDGESRIRYQLEFVSVGRMMIADRVFVKIEP